MENIVNGIAIAFSYLLGAVPFGLLFGRILGGVDVRGTGSGNIGATNVLRSAGKKAALLTLLADALKGFLPVLLAARYLDGEWMPALVGMASVLGHNYPVYLKFRGGKGVATSFGVVLAISPGLGLVCLIAWAGAASFWRYSSLSALVAFALYPLLTFGVYGDDRVRSLLSIFLFGMIYYRHRENIKRLLSGTEPKIGRKSRQTDRAGEGSYNGD